MRRHLLCLFAILLLLLQIGYAQEETAPLINKDGDERKQIADINNAKLRLLELRNKKAQVEAEMNDLLSPKTWVIREKKDGVWTVREKKNDVWTVREKKDDVQEDATWDIVAFGPNETEEEKGIATEQEVERQVEETETEMEARREVESIAAEMKSKRIKEEEKIAAEREAETEVVVEEMEAETETVVEEMEAETEAEPTATKMKSNQKFTLNGYLKDGETGETLIGASVFIKELGTGTISNEYGFYSISVPADTYTVEFGYIGFSTITETINLTEKVKLDIEMGENAEDLAEIVVTSKIKDSNVSELQMSVNKLDVATIKKVSSLLGEVEIIRSLQLLPGVSTVGEGATGFNVRGGSIDQNLVLLDEAPVYNSSHLFGFFSVFNPDAVKDVQLYKGGVPSRFGGRLSSILDVRMKEGNNKKLALTGGIGTIFSRLSLEAPIIKDKASFIIAARRSYIDVLAAPFLEDGLAGNTVNFYDLTVKTNYNISDKNRIFLSGYLGRDNLEFGEDVGFSWGNKTGTARWNHLFSEKLFSNLTLFYSNYDYEISNGFKTGDGFKWDAKIINYSAKPEFTYYISPKNVLRFGGQGIVYEFEPGNGAIISDDESTDLSLEKKYAIESAAYVENKLTFGKFETNYGLRLSHFNYVGEGNAYEYGDAPAGTRRYVTETTRYDQWESIKTYLNFEPRVAIKYQIDKDKSLKASYMRTAQYIHLISNTTASTPLDIWTPSTNNIKPQQADQYAIGYFQNLKNNAYEISAEGYYKETSNLLDYIVEPAPELVLNEFLEGEILSGKGRAYGLELMAKKNNGVLTGWLSYTLARTELQVDGINKNEWYPSRFDQTHNLSLTTFYQASKRWSLSANFAYITGAPITFANAGYYQQGYYIPHNSEQTRNNSRIPDYHRVDISATLEGKKNDVRRRQGRWVFSIYNLYSQRNAFSAYQRQDNTRTQIGAPVPTAAYKLSVVGNFIPAVAYNFEF